MSLVADFLSFHQWFNDNKSRLEEEVKVILNGERFSTYLNETGKFNAIARPEDNDNRIQKYGEYSHYIVNVIQIFSNESRFSKDILKMVVYETVVNKLLSKLLRQPKDQD